MKEIMTNIGNEKSLNKVHRTIVPIVPVPPMKSIQSIEYQSLRAGTIRNFIVPAPLFIMKKIEKLGLSPTGKFGVIRRWLGIYSKEEREVLDYARKLKKTTMQIARGQLTLLSRPYWMRHEDWREVRKLQNKLERRCRK
jgi:hypothetical protein